MDEIHHFNDFGRLRASDGITTERSNSSVSRYLQEWSVSTVLPMPGRFRVSLGILAEHLNSSVACYSAEVVGSHCPNGVRSNSSIPHHSNLTLNFERPIHNRNGGNPMFHRFWSISSAPIGTVTFERLVFKTNGGFPPHRQCLVAFKHYRVIWRNSQIRVSASCLPQWWTFFWYTSAMASFVEQ